MQSKKTVTEIITEFSYNELEKIHKLTTEQKWNYNKLSLNQINEIQKLPLDAIKCTKLYPGLKINEFTAEHAEIVELLNAIGSITVSDLAAIQLTINNLILANKTIHPNMLMDLIPVNVKKVIEDISRVGANALKKAKENFEKQLKKSLTQQDIVMNIGGAQVQEIINVFLPRDVKAIGYDVDAKLIKLAEVLQNLPRIIENQAQIYSNDQYNVNKNNVDMKNLFAEELFISRNIAPIESFAKCIASKRQELLGITSKVAELNKSLEDKTNQIKNSLNRGPELGYQTVNLYLKMNSDEQEQVGKDLEILQLKGSDKQKINELIEKLKNLKDERADLNKQSRIISELSQEKVDEIEKQINAEIGKITLDEKTNLSQALKKLDELFDAEINKSVSVSITQKK